MLTRRMFHTRLLATASLFAVPGIALSAPTGASVYEIWLNRLTFGASPSSRAAIAAMGREVWLDDQLARKVSDPGLDAMLSSARLRIAFDAGQVGGRKWEAVDQLRPLRYLDAPAADLVTLAVYRDEVSVQWVERIRPMEEVIAASLIRAVHAEAQLREVMTQFWHEHFSVNAAKKAETAAFFPLYDAAMRKHALGNFRVLLGEVARSPSMLYFLDNDTNRATPANENFARELMELHTLGAENYLNDRYSRWDEVPGATEGLAEGYLDLDVYEVARAFTGWSVGDWRDLNDGSRAPETGEVHFIAAWHDPYQKRVLGRDFPPNRGPMVDGDEVLDILARHPGTARHVCRKIARRLLSDEPEAGLVARLADVFLAGADAPDQIARVVRALVLSPEFEAPPAKVRRPFEVLASLYRATGAKVTTTQMQYRGLLARAGWWQHQYVLPTGHPDRNPPWTGAGTLNRIVDLVMDAHEDWFDGATADLVAVLPGETAEGFVRRHAGAVAPARGGEVAADVLRLAAHRYGMPIAGLPDEERHTLATQAIAFAALTPDFLLR
ncbi:DUF1800 domain-containing protein [Tabrizicola sp. BL-A-41-H6]|uniref:DUF1800 domain-containing protein n=1 Tax=Tabrizicola sp. BL-A-41-H6 TaxID=3421107 RepID=UPI003D66B578